MLFGPGRQISHVGSTIRPTPSVVDSSITNSVSPAPFSADARMRFIPSNRL